MLQKLFKALTVGHWVPRNRGVGSIIGRGGKYMVGVKGRMRKEISKMMESRGNVKQFAILNTILQKKKWKEVATIKKKVGTEREGYRRTEDQNPLFPLIY